jgi:hypothetical protein
MAQEIWRQAHLAVGLNTFGVWNSPALQVELRLLLNTMLKSRPDPGLQLSGIEWDRLRCRLTRHGAATSEEFGRQGLLARADPPPGLYRLDVEVPVRGEVASGSEWILFASWRVGKYTHGYGDLTTAGGWSQRLRKPPEEIVTQSSLTAEGWWAGGFGPDNFDYAFGLHAEAQVSLPAGTYRFTLEADDGARVWVGGRLVIAAWPDDPKFPRTALVKLNGDESSWRVDYVQAGHASHLRLRVEPVGSGS